MRVALACLVLIALTPAAAQLKNPRRISLQLGDAVEGSRVTVISDAALSDYEAFRRGDRFYVKLPLAEFATAVPSLRANGFDNVQVQKVGDGVIISFKLQPGATARVSLRGNRLDVIFTAANRSSFLANRTATPSEARAENPQGSVNRDTAGPMPAGSRDRVVSEATADGNTAGLQDPWAVNPASGLGRRNRRGSGSQSVGSNTGATASASQSPTPAYTPAGSSSYPAVSSTPATNYPASSTTSVSRSGSSLRQRASAVVQWVRSNRLASLLGALVLVGLILYLALVLRKRSHDARVKAAKSQKVQPKFSHDDTLSELSPPSTVTPISSVQNEPVTQNSVVTPESPANRIPTPTQTPKTANATAAAGASSGWGIGKPAVASTGAGPVEYSSEEEEREVFEL